MRKRLWMLVLISPLLLAGMCEDDSPTGTGTPVPDPTLDNLWPNADSASWTYALHERIWGDFETNVILYDTPEEVPPAPSLAEVECLLEHHPHGFVQSEDEGSYTLQFDGEITLGSGATVQNLVETTEWATKADAPRGPAGDALRRRILTVRPDLRERAAQLGLRAAAGEPGLRDDIEPLLLHGYAWEKTSEYIGTYNVAAELLAWKFLESDLAIGHEFTHQLLPDLDDDIWLHARIIAQGTIVTPAGRFRKAVTCFYYIDYGVAGLTGDGPDILGYMRMLDYGTVSFAPEIGPVRSYERKFVSVGDGGALGPGIGDLTVSLTATSEAR